MALQRAISRILIVYYKLSMNTLQWIPIYFACSVRFCFISLQRRVLWGCHGRRKIIQEIIRCEMHQQEKPFGERGSGWERNRYLEEVSQLVINSPCNIVIFYHPVTDPENILVLHAFPVRVRQVMSLARPPVLCTLSHITAYFLSCYFVCRVNHPNIIRLWDIFDNKTHLYLVMDLWVLCSSCSIIMALYTLGI